MEEPRLKSGELVVYVDPDLIQWGPWEIVRLCCDEVTVLVDGLIEHPFPRTGVRKVDEGKGGINREER